MITHINIVGILDDTKKDEFIKSVREQYNIPLMYTKKKDIVEIVQTSINESDYEKGKIIGVMFCIQYKENAFKC